MSPVRLGATQTGIWRMKNGIAFPLVPKPSLQSPPAEGWAEFFINQVVTNGRYRVPRGIYEIDGKTHPHNPGYRTAITLPNGTSNSDRSALDFSQAELLLKAGQPRMTAGGLTTGQLSDIISNRYLGSTAVGQICQNIDVIVGCLNGNAVNQGAHTSSEGASESWWDGIAFRNPLNVTVRGGFGPYSSKRWVARGDGVLVPITTYGQIKNIPGWDGGGGRTETFSYTFDDLRDNCRGESLELFCDDGTTRASTGYSSNNGPTSAGIHVTHQDIYSHDMKSHGGTSWHTVGVRVERALFERTAGAHFRYEYGWNHEAIDVICRAGLQASSNGLNLKGEQTPPGGSTMLTTTRLTIAGVLGHGVQLNSIIGLVLNGWRGTIGTGKNVIDYVDAQYGSRASTGVVNNLVTI